MKTKCQRITEMDFSQPNRSLMEQHGLSSSYVSQLRKESGSPRVGRSGPKHSSVDDQIKRIIQKYGEIDFTKHDCELAELHGFSRERARQIRKIFGAPKISKKAIRPHQSTTEARDWVSKRRAHLAHKTLTQIMKESSIKVSRRVMSEALSANNIKHRHASSKYPWDKMNWQLPNSVLIRLWVGRVTAARYTAFSRARHQHGHTAKWAGWEEPKIFPSFIREEEEKVSLWKGMEV